MVSIPKDLSSLITTDIDRCNEIEDSLKRPWASGFFYLWHQACFYLCHKLCDMKIRGCSKYSFVDYFLFKLHPAYQGENIEFICHKTHKATNTCHFNFIINGAKYRHVDIGCKFSKKKDELIKKVKDGSLALAKDWKIDCPEPKGQN